MLGLSPNITGSWQTGHSLSLVSKTESISCSGCYSPHKNTGGSVAGTTGIFSKGISFDAGKSNKIYGVTTTVQPSAFQTLIIIKV